MVNKLHICSALTVPILRWRDGGMHPTEFCLVVAKCCIINGIL